MAALKAGGLQYVYATRATDGRQAARSRGLCLVRLAETTPDQVTVSKSAVERSQPRSDLPTPCGVAVIVTTGGTNNACHLTA